MPSRAKTYTCLTCGKEFQSSNKKPEYCSRPCRDQNPARKKRYSDMYRKIPDRPCVICGKMFKPHQEVMNNGTPVLCCSFACSRLKVRKHQRIDITNCLICGKELTRRQISNQNKFCSRACHGAHLKRWHAKPEVKIFFREHGTKCAISGQRAPTSIELLMAGALESEGLEYEYQYPIGNSHGLIFSCDFAFPQAKLIVECDGDYWHTLPRVQARDKHKAAYLKAAGYTLLRFTETQINQDVHACVQTILSYL